MELARGLGIPSRRVEDGSRVRRGREVWNGNRGRRWREEAAMGATQSERCTETAKSSLPLRERAEDPVLRAAATSARQVGVFFSLFLPN